jgi:predicted ATPase/signal transduction histidine kinase/tRNA A-37 threonylcarbamoyl transferase component Bud32
MSPPGYELRELLHQGVKSEIFRATRLADGRRVVLKIPHDDGDRHQRLAELRHEFHVAARVKGPGVVEALELIEVGERPFLVFEDIDGVSLARAFPAKLGVASFFPVALQICDSLAEIHARGVIHKDIKPQNIIINASTGQVKLTDLAIASLLADEASTLAPPDRLVGTLAYMAPEQTGRIGRGIDARADLYALGVTFFELLAGRRPFAQTDPMELVHAHIAREPPRLVDVDPSIGPELSDLVAHLLFKDADARYRSALAVRADLRHLLEERGCGAVTPFTPGLRHRGAEFRLPQALYGRERERERLLEAFASAAAGSRALVLVAGTSGAGKSALVHEVHRPMVARRGTFVAGKFDQFNRSVPFASLVQALRLLIDRVVAGSDAEVEVWRRRLLDALGPQVSVLQETLPELELVVGRHPPAAPLAGAEAQNRLHLAVLRFFAAFARADHPLVLFLDDLQWADAATLALLKALVTDPELAHVLVIGAYRDQEVDAHHPLTRALREIDASPTRVVRITLGPLVVGDVRRLIADALTEEPGDVSRLADEVFRRTEGNPLFVREFLKQIVADRLLRYDEADERWRWDVAEIRAAPIPDDVADLLLDRIRRLPPSARRALQVAACVGVAFDLQTLVAVTGADEGELGRDLWDAIQSGLVAALDASYRLLPHSGAGGRPLRLRFVHDRIRQAAYSLVRPEEMPALHLAIGRHLLAALPSRERAEFLDAVDHLNRGRALIVDPAERRSLLALNVEAGRRARAATAYAAAVNFFGAGASLVDDEGWRSDYPLAYALNLGLAEGLYLAGEIDAADAAFERLSARVTSPLDALSVRSLRVTLYVAIGRSSQAIELGVEALRLAGVDIPGDDDGLAAAAAAERARLHERFAARPLAARIDDPPAQDPELRAVIKVMTDLMAPTQLTRQRLFEHLCLKQINLSLEHGHAEASPYGYLVYAFYLTTVAGPVREAYDFGEAALALNERLGAADQASRLNFVFGSILHAYRPLSEVLDFFERARAAGLESGDYIFASYACSHAAIAQLGLGLRVDALLIAVDEALTLMRRTRVASSTAALQITRQLALALRGDTAAPTRLGDAAFDEDAAFAAFDQGRLSFAALWYCIARLALAVLHRDDAAATRWMAEAERRLLNSSWYLTTELTFYAGLHLAATLRRASAEARGPIAARLAEHRRRYAELARSSPANFAAKLALLDAEIAAAAGDRLAALGGYDAAIAEARRQGVAPTEALARELAGRFYLDAGHEVFAASLLADAEVVFRRWGALAKADALVREHGELLRRAVTRSPLRVAAAAELSETSVTATTIDPRLDLSSVIKAAQAFAGEIDLVALLTKVMGVLAENAGAERGALALLEGDALHLAVTYGPEGVVVDERRPLSSDDVPAGVLRHSLRSGRLLLGEDVLESPSFAGDPYLHRRRPLSLLAMPIAYQGRRLGVLYLENRQVWGAFNHYRLETLRLLCAQLAIAIANARMFGELRVARRVAEEANVAKSRFMLNMSHELRTPLNVVIGTSEMLAEEAEDDGDDDAAAELGKITDAGQGLLRIITDVLEITELESGRVELAITSFALRPLLDEVAEAHLGVLEASGGALEVELAAADLTVTNDRARLARILDHVLGNAVRFAGDGVITVRAWAADQRLRIAIIDRGIGMTRQQSARIFDAFQQADDSPTRRFGGMGLGLAIVRRLCERMGGSIGVESELGVGSAFTIDLPLVVAA